MRLFLCASIGLATAVFVACAATSDPLCDNDVCVTPDGGGANADAGDECLGDPTNPACATNDNALFVDKKASTVGADGTKEHPFAAINDAMRMVSSARRRIYVCPGTYETPVIVSNGAALYGGLGCDWNKTNDRPTILNNTGVAVTIKDAQFVALSDLVISASPESTSPGASAVAVFISKSSNVTLQRLQTTTGPGVGADKTPDTGINYDTPAATAGGAASSPQGGAGPTCNCKDGTSSTGGHGADSPQSNQTPGSANPPVGTPNAGVAGNPCKGGDGQDAPRVEKATPTIPIGTITADGWTPTKDRSSAGLTGRVAQGGGGGPPSTPYGGGGGGCGGCGGAGGAGGAPGGSSFGVMVFQSTKTSVIDCTITVGNGAQGGAGGKGQTGQTGGAFGAPGQPGLCQGGPGGDGSGGAGGTGGHGGHSVAVAYVGELPFVSGGTRTTGTPGPGGAGGQGGGKDIGADNSGFDGDPGTPGSKEDILQLSN